MTADLVLWLDLADANQMADDAVRQHVPRDARTLQLTQYHAVQYPSGTPPMSAQWAPVLDAIDRMVRDARKLEKQSPGCRYWVTGRAGLPAFFHLGYRLSKMAAVTFVHQPKNGANITVLPLDVWSSIVEQPPYFQRTPWPIPQSDSSDPPALVLASGIEPTDHQIQQALAERKTKPARIVRAHSPAWLDRNNVIPAMREIDELIRATASAHSARSTLAIFIAGPTTLAFLTGNALNPRVCRDVQIFEYDGSRYSVAYELPYPPVPDRNRVLFFMASPAGVPKLALDKEIRAIHLERSSETVADRLVIEDIAAAQPKDAFDALRTRAPGVVHFSGHGETGELMFEDSGGQLRPLSISDLAETLRLAGRSVRLVVLNACHSASHARELLAHVECVVAMRGPIWDTDARRFSATFYRHLAEGDSVRDAFDKGRLDVRLDRPAGAPGSRTRDVVAKASEPGAHEEPLQLIERDPGCASMVFLVRRR